MVREGANSSAHSLNTFRGRSSGPEPLLVTYNPFSTLITSISEKAILASMLSDLAEIAGRAIPDFWSGKYRVKVIIKHFCFISGVSDIVLASDTTAGIWRVIGLDQT